MSATWRTPALSAALLAMLCTPSVAWAQGKVRDRVANAIESIQGACATDIDKFCGNVTRGEGRQSQCGGEAEGGETVNETAEHRRGL